MKHFLHSAFTAALLTVTFGSFAQGQHQRLAKGLLAKEAKPTASAAARGVLGAVTVPGRTVYHTWDTQINRWASGLVTTTTYNAQGKPSQIISSDSATNEVFAL
ncbi:hypothetical protein [Hymenobacter koreensis]|uniref:YD repeat-containing protein n=1 Tax=Hymenobacter koreensis TaxID=1084523 RepID=A0ABP8ITL7_9BACT